MSNNNKTVFLGMPYGTANAKLRKMILFHLLKKYHENICYRCGKEIETRDTLSIEHKKPWLYENVDLFWDLDNIAFSHLVCNIKTIRRVTVEPRHGTYGEYRNRGCRCDLCRNAVNIGTKARMRKFRNRNQSETFQNALIVQLERT